METKTDKAKREYAKALQERQRHALTALEGISIALGSDTLVVHIQEARKELKVRLGHFG